MTTDGGKKAIAAGVSGRGRGKSRSGREDRVREVSTADQVTRYGVIGSSTALAFAQCDWNMMDSVIQLEGCFLSQLSLSHNFIIYDKEASTSIFKAFYGYRRLELPTKTIVTGNGNISTSSGFVHPIYGLVYVQESLPIKIGLKDSCATLHQHTLFLRLSPPLQTFHQVIRIYMKSTIRIRDHLESIIVRNHILRDDIDRQTLSALAHASSIARASLLTFAPRVVCLLSNLSSMSVVTDTCEFVLFIEQQISKWRLVAWYESRSRYKNCLVLRSSLVELLGRIVSLSWGKTWFSECLSSWPEISFVYSTIVLQVSVTSCCI